jgi:hypothetical protein
MSNPKSAIEGLVLWEYHDMPMVEVISGVLLSGGGAYSAPETT